MKIADYEITNEEHRALAYLVPDPDAWLEHAAKQPRGDKAINHKIKKALALVSGVSDEDYTTRVERDALEEAEMQPTPEQVALSHELTLARLEADVVAAKNANLYLALTHLEQQIAEVAKLDKL